MKTLEDQKKDLVEESLIYVQPMEIFLSDSLTDSLFFLQSIRGASAFLSFMIC